MASILDGLKGKRQYTIGELMTVDAGRQERAAGCKATLVKTYHELQPETVLDKFRAFLGKSSVPIYYMTFKFEVESGSGSKYNVYIKTNPDFSLKNWASNQVQIYCECADFKYRSAYTLNRRGSLFLTSKIASELGEAMSDAPKRGTTLLCKHAYAALSWLMNNWTFIMRTA